VKRRTPTCLSSSIIGDISPVYVRAQEGGISEIDHDTVAYHYTSHLAWSARSSWNFPILMATWKLAPALRRRQLRGY